MKAAITAVAVFCASTPLFSQATGVIHVAYLNYQGQEDSYDPIGGNALEIRYEFSVGPGGVKTLDYTVCDVNPLSSLEYDAKLDLLAFASGGPRPLCTRIEQTEAEMLTFVKQAIAALKTWAYEANAPYKVNYGALAERDHFLLDTVAPTAPPDPFMVFVDGLTGNVMKFDLTTGIIVNQVLPPVTAIGPVGLRPSSAGSTNEVWVANQTPQITVVDVGAQTVLANIATPSIPSAFVPVGVVFTNSGNTAFEAVSYSSPDSSGNLGALVILDAVNRIVKSTFPLKYAPTAVLMAPDALSIYLLSETNGELTYYDVLSGTADLSVSTYTPGFNNGYSGGNAFVHPDGTRLFWNSGPNLEVFDLTRRLVTSTFPSGLPSGSGVTLEVSQDGSTALLANGQGTIVAVDTQFGLVLGTSQNSTATQGFPGN
jgi:hypothetical protein